MLIVRASIPIEQHWMSSIAKIYAVSRYKDSGPSISTNRRLSRSRRHDMVVEPHGYRRHAAWILEHVGRQKPNGPILDVYVTLELGTGLPGLNQRPEKEKSARVLTILECLTEQITRFMGDDMGRGYSFQSVQG
ncbi:hypothetical protein AAE478_000203 [Parahypoxylon ruwenzoriense]